MTAAVKNVLWLMVGLVALAVGGLFVMGSPKVPYNVRELFASENPHLSLLVFSVLFYWVFGVPVVWFAWLRQGSAWRVLSLSLLLVVQGLVSYGLLRASVPMESIHDIVGAPVMEWPWEWELIGRFLGLFSAPALLVAGGGMAAALVNGSCGDAMRSVGRWLGTCVLVLPVAHWVVVKAAGTDNITELMASGGSWFTSALLSSWILGISATASMLSLVMAGRGRLRAALVILLVSCPLCYAALYFGTETTVVKYEQHFSALQFLLSADRSHFAQGGDLLVRYACFHLGAVVALAVAQVPFWCFFEGQALSNTLNHFSWRQQ